MGNFSSLETRSCREEDLTSHHSTHLQMLEHSVVRLGGSVGLLAGLGIFDYSNLAPGYGFISRFSCSASIEKNHNLVPEAAKKVAPPLLVAV